MVSFDSQGLAEGTYQGVVQMASNGGSLSIPVDVLIDGSVDAEDAPAGGNELADVKSLSFSMQRVDAELAGLPHSPVEAIRGGDPQHNARALKALLDGVPGPYRDAVVFNAAATLIVSGKVDDWRTGAQLASDMLDSGAARQKLADWIALVDAA